MLIPLFFIVKNIFEVAKVQEEFTEKLIIMAA